MRINLIIISLIFIIYSTAYSQNTNYKIIDSLISCHIDKLMIYLNSTNDSCFTLETNHSEVDFIIESNLIKKMPDYSFIRYKDPKCPIIKIQTPNISVKYIYLTKDNIARHIEVEMSAIIEKTNQPIKLIHSQIQSYSDTIPYNQINNIQRSPYNFDKSEIPTEENSFYENIIQPIIFVGTAIITIAILFTVRSQ